MKIETELRKMASRLSGMVRLRFNGDDYCPSRDDPRLKKQVFRVFFACIGRGWKTLREIADTTGDPEASVSAQLRHLRKPRFGSFVVEKRHRGDPANGLYEYRVLPPEPPQQQDAWQ